MGKTESARPISGDEPSQRDALRSSSFSGLRTHAALSSLITALLIGEPDPATAGPHDARNTSPLQSLTVGNEQARRITQLFSSVPCRGPMFTTPAHLTALVVSVGEHSFLELQVDVKPLYRGTANSTALRVPAVCSYDRETDCYTVVLDSTPQPLKLSIPRDQQPHIRVRKDDGSLQLEMHLEGQGVVKASVPQNLESSGTCSIETRLGDRMKTYRVPTERAH